MTSFYRAEAVSNSINLVAGSARVSTQCGLACWDFKISDASFIVYQNFNYLFGPN